MTRYKNFNIRQLQTYAALCLWHFCRHLNIKHDAIDELILYLMSMFTAGNLSEWEQRGTEIVMTGRGDPLPEEVTNLLAPDCLEVFNSLVDSCVEVGIVDMYGACTNQPVMFVERCTEVLKHCDVDIPSTEDLDQYRRGTDEWGEFISDAELNEILDVYGVNVF